MSKSGQENRGYTPRNDGLSDDRSTIQPVRAHRRPTLPDSLVLPASFADGHRLATALAADGPIGRQTRLPSRDFRSRQLFGKVCARAEVHLVGCLAMKRGMREMLVVILHIERHQFLDASDCIERVQVQPRAVERGTPRWMAQWMSRVVRTRFRRR